MPKKMTLFKLLFLCWPYLLLLIFSQIFSQFLIIKLSLIIKEIFDAAAAGNTKFLLSRMPKFLLLVFGVLPASLWLPYARSLFVNKTSFAIKQRYLKRIFEKNINEFQSSGISKYINDITNNANTLEERYFQQITVIIQAIVIFLGALIIIINVSWRALMLALPLLLILFFIMYRSGNFLRKPEQQKAEDLEEYTRFAKESLSAFRIVKSFQLGKRIMKDFDRRSKAVQDKGYEIEKRSTYIQALNQLLGSAGALFALLTGVNAVLTGTISMGVFFVLVSAISNLVHPLFLVSEAFPHIRSVPPIFEKMENNLQNQELQQINLPFEGLRQQIKLSNICFNYPGIPVLKDANVTFTKGGKYLLIGPSGSGKSTIIRLLRKYFAPDQGTVLLDKTPLNEIETDSYYQKLANIEQHVFIFDDTIRNNITMYQNIPDSKLKTAITSAGLDNLVNTRKNGLDDILINNGAELSGGEKARIAIARGLLSEADIILLDEPFASLDNEIAQKIEHSLLKLPNITVINVSHVIFDATKHLYDAIYVVKDGQIHRS